MRCTWFRMRMIVNIMWCHIVRILSGMSIQFLYVQQECIERLWQWLEIVQGRRSILDLRGSAPITTKINVAFYIAKLQWLWIRFCDATTISFFLYFTNLCRTVIHIILGYQIPRSVQEQHTGHTAVAYVIASIARVGVFYSFSGETCECTPATGNSIWVAGRVPQFHAQRFCLYGIHRTAKDRCVRYSILL